MYNNIKYASQLKPLKIMKKHFKTKKDKEYIASIYKIIKKYNPNISDEDIVSMCSKISKGGCTYASMANAIMEQISDINYLEEKLGYSLTNSEGIIEYDKLMVDIYACISSMVELEVCKYDIYYYPSIKEGYESILNKPFINNIQALNELNDIGIIIDGNSEDGKIIFKNVKQPKKQKLIGTYQELAYSLFNVNNSNMTKEQLEKLLKDNNIYYKFNDELDYSKFSGLGSVELSNIKKWVEKFIQINNLELDIDIQIINSYNEEYSSFISKISEILSNNYSLFVSANPELEVWMTDGKTWEKPAANAGHRMNFQGFDQDSNIFLCSWGKTYMIPKEFYINLEFTAIKFNEKVDKKTR